MAHRAYAQSIVGVTEKQMDGLSRGRVKGSNRRVGYQHREESKRKISVSHKQFWAANPDLAKARGAKCRGENHYNWKGGLAKINASIRQMTENRRWMDAIKARDDYHCVRCGSQENLEAHHIESLGDMIVELGIKSRIDARKHVDKLWNLSNGETLCGVCHYSEHGRIGVAGRRMPMFETCLECGMLFAIRPSRKGFRVFCGLECQRINQRRNPRRGETNSNWRGGLINRECRRCGSTFSVKLVVAKRGGGIYCCIECKNDHQRKRTRSPSGAFANVVQEAS